MFKGSKRIYATCPNFKRSYLPMYKELRYDLYIKLYAFKCSFKCFKMCHFDIHSKRYEHLTEDCHVKNPCAKCNSKEKCIPKIKNVGYAFYQVMDMESCMTTCLVHVKTPQR